MTEYSTSREPSPFPREVAAGGVVLTLTPDQVYVEFATLRGDGTSPPSCRGIDSNPFRTHPASTAFRSPETTSRASSGSDRSPGTTWHPSLGSCARPTTCGVLVPYTIGPTSGRP